MNFIELCEKVEREKAMVFKKNDTTFFLMNPEKRGHQYWIEFDRIDTPGKILKWVAHLSGKTWVTREMIFHLIDEASKRIGYEVFKGV